MRTIPPLLGREETDISPRDAEVSPGSEWSHRSSEEIVVVESVEGTRVRVRGEDVYLPTFLARYRRSS